MMIIDVKHVAAPSEARPDRARDEAETYHSRLLSRSSRFAREKQWDSCPRRRLG